MTAGAPGRPAQRPAAAVGEQQREHDAIGEDAVGEPVEYAPEVLVVDNREIAGTTRLEDWPWSSTPSRKSVRPRTSPARTRRR